MSKPLTPQAYLDKALPAIRPNTSATLAFTTASQSGVISASLVRLVATANCWLNFGSDPTASASGADCVYLPSGTPEYFGINSGDKISVVQDSGGGNLCITTPVEA